MGKALVAAPAGCYFPGPRATASSSTNGPRTNCHTLAGGVPILALDMYEHSYHIDYGAKAANLRRYFHGSHSLEKRRPTVCGSLRSFVDSQRTER